MIKRNVEFQEEYIRLDNLCEQCYSNNAGVSEYIKEMENNWNDGIKSVKDWQYVYKSLKHVRYIRNQLAHDVGALNSDIVESSDLAFVQDLYKDIIKGNDPLAVLRKNRKVRKPAFSTITKPKTNKPKNKRKSIFFKIKKFIATIIFIGLIILAIYIISKV